MQLGLKKQVIVLSFLVLGACFSNKADNDQPNIGVVLKDNLSRAEGQSSGLGVLGNSEGEMLQELKAVVQADSEVVKEQDFFSVLATEQEDKDSPFTPTAQQSDSENSNAPAAAAVAVAAGVWGKLPSIFCPDFNQLREKLPTLKAIKGKIPAIELNKKTVVPSLFFAVTLAPWWMRALQAAIFKCKSYKMRLKEAKLLLKDVEQEFAQLLSTFGSKSEKECAEAVTCWVDKYMKQQTFILAFIRGFDWYGLPNKYIGFNFMFVEAQIKRNIKLLEYYERNLTGKKAKSGGAELLKSMDELIKKLYILADNIKASTKYKEDLANLKIAIGKQKEQEQAEKENLAEKENFDGKDHIWE